MSIRAVAWAKQQTTGKGATKLILLLLADYAGADGWCWPHVSTLADEAELAPRTVRRCLDALEASGLIEKQPRRRADGTYGSTRYRLAWREVEALDDDDLTLPAQSTDGGEPVDDPEDNLTSGRAQPEDNDAPSRGHSGRSGAPTQGREPSREPSRARPRAQSRPMDEGPTLPARDVEGTMAMLDERVHHPWTAPPDELRSRWKRSPTGDDDDDNG